MSFRAARALTYTYTCTCCTCTCTDYRAWECHVHELCCHVYVPGVLQGLAQSLVERLSEWCFDCKELRVHLQERQGRSQLLAALRHTLRQLCGGLQTTRGTTLYLGALRWDADMLRGYVRAMHALAEHGLVRHSVRNRGPLTDELLGIVLEVRLALCFYCS